MSHGYPYFLFFFLMFFLAAGCRQILVEGNTPNFVATESDDPEPPPIVYPTAPTVTANPYGDETSDEIGDSVITDDPPLEQPPPGNRQPIFSRKPTGAIVVYSDSRMRFTFEASDEDGDDLLFTIGRGKHDGLSLTPNGILNFEPDRNMVGRSLMVDIAVNDGFHQVIESVTLEVLDPIEGMIKIDDFYIDRYENVLSFDPYCGPNSYFGQNSDDYLLGFDDMIGTSNEDLTETEDDRLFGCSVAQQLPSRFITWFQARQACLNVGKRLCGPREYSRGCKGTPAGSCNWDKGSPVETGSIGACKSSEGVYDLSGNLKEWIDSLICEPASELDPCAEQCGYLMGKWWCSRDDRVDGFREKKPLGVGMLQMGGFFGVNSEKYSGCSRHEAALAEETRESAGFRCCKSAPEIVSADQIEGEPCRGNSDDEVCKWCGKNATKANLATCMACYKGTGFDQDRNDTRWNGIECVCRGSGVVEAVDGSVIRNGCRSVVSDNTAYCNQFRTANQPECNRCLRDCGPNATWSDANGGQCFDDKGKSVKSWDGCSATL